MENLILFLLVLVAGSLLVGLYFGLPIWLSVLLYRWLARKGRRKAGLIIVISVIGLLSFLAYSAIYPNDDFYKNDFERYTGLTFPSSGRFIAKESSYPDIHGKYTSDAVIELTENEYKLLIMKVSDDSTFMPDTLIGYSGKAFENATEGVNTNDIVKIVRKNKMNIGFLNDNKTIIIERRLW